MISTHRLASTSALIVCMVVPAIVVLAGCNVPPINTAQLTLSPGSPLVARKIERPLIIVLDPQLVPDDFVMSSMGKQVAIQQIREFVRRDLRRAMLNFFKTVEVVSPETTPAPSAHVAHVRIDRFDAHGTFPTTPGVGMGSQVFGRMTWSFAILPAEGRDYLFSYAATASGDFPLVRIGQVSTMIESTYVEAIELMVHHFVEEGAYARLLALDESQPIGTATNPQSDRSSTPSTEVHPPYSEEETTEAGAPERPPSSPD